MQKNWDIKVSKINKSFYLLANNSACGKVHSIFSHVVNLEIQGEIFALQGKDTPLTPLSIQVNGENTFLEKLEISEKMEVFLSKEKIQIGNHFLRLNEATILESNCLRRVSEVKMKSLYKMILEVLPLYNSNAGFSDSVANQEPKKTDDFITTILRNKIVVMKQVVKEEPREIVDEMTSLLGLGIGLTPSGDDFLLGVMFALYSCGNDYAKNMLSEMSAIMKRLEEKTNKISGAYLKKAFVGEFSQKLLCLLEEGSSKKEIIEVIKTGHSSGVDTLNGIAFGYEFLLSRR